MATGRFFPATGIDLGVASDYRTFNQSTLPRPGMLGHMVEDGIAVFRLVQYTKGTTPTATIDGGLLYWKTKASWLATPDPASSEGLADDVAGGTHVAIATANDLNYLFVQCGGDQKAVVVAASTVAGDHMTGHASTANVLTRTAAGTAAVDKQVGTALSTRGSTTSDNGASVANSAKIRWILGALI